MNQMTYTEQKMKIPQPKGFKDRCQKRAIKISILISAIHLKVHYKGFIFLSEIITCNFSVSFRNSSTLQEEKGARQNILKKKAKKVLCGKQFKISDS